MATTVYNIASMQPLGPNNLGRFLLLVLVEWCLFAAVMVPVATAKETISYEKMRDAVQKWDGLPELKAGEVAINTEELVEQWHAAASKGNPRAQLILAFLYDAGHGVPKDLKRAIQWCQKAAENGLAPAQCLLALWHQFGYGVPQDFAQASKWYRQAAAQGFAPAQWNLGRMYDQGLGLPQDHVAAVKWYRLSAEQGYALAQHDLGVSYAMGEGVGSSLTEAARWYRLAAEQGHAPAQHNLAGALRHGRGVQTNYVEAARWYRKAAEQGVGESQAAYGLCLLDGKGISANPKEAIRWFERAVAQGNPLGHHCLAMTLASQPGSETNWNRVIAHMKEAANLGFGPAQLELGFLYRDGKHLTNDVVAAYTWFTLAARNGMPKAQDEIKRLARRMAPDQVLAAFRAVEAFVPQTSLETTNKFFPRALPEDKASNPKRKPVF